MELKTRGERVVVPAGEGRAVPVSRGAALRVVDLNGGQVGDVFALSAADPTEYHGAAHTARTPAACSRPLASSS